MAKVLVIGGGGREHAIVDALSRSSKVEKIYCAPGNAGIAAQAECVPLKDTQVNELKAFALENGIDLTVVGPEASLALGICDIFREAGLAIFGPSKAAARIEASKDFAKQLMKKYSVPTAAFETFEDYDKALEYVRNGRMGFTIQKDSATLNYKCLRMIKAVVEGSKPDINDVKTYNNGVITIPAYLCIPRIIDKENIDSIK